LERERKKKRTKQDKGSYTSGVHFCIGIEKASVFDDESVVKADVTGDAKGKARCGVKGELDDGNTCMGERHEVKFCFWRR